MSEMQRLGLHARAHARWGDLGDMVWVLVTAAVLIAIDAFIAYATASAVLFVSIGTIVFQRIEKPMSEGASPRNTVLGNAVALLVGFAALAIFGLAQEPSSMLEGVTIARLCAATFAVAVTGALLVLLDAMHIPAGATTLLVALGVVHRGIDVVYVFAGVVLICVAGWILNHLAGIPSPLWSAHASPPVRDRSAA